MDDAKFTQLMQSEVDGMNSSAESAELHSYLAKNADARRTFEEMRSVVDTLESMDEVEPPANMRRAIMDALPANYYQARGVLQSSGFFRTLANVISGGSGGGFPVVFATGLLAGVALTLLFNIGSGTSATDIAGSMMKQSGYSTGESISVETPVFDGIIRIHRSDAFNMLELDLGLGDKVVDVLIEYETDNLGFTGFEKVVSGTVEGFSFQSGRLGFKAQGAVKFGVKFQSHTAAYSPVNITFLQENKVLFNAAISLE